MENAKPSPAGVAIKWALINFVISVVITYAFQFLNVDQSSSAKYLTYIPFIAFMMLAIKEYKDQSGGFITFGKGFMSGFLFSVFAGIMGAIFIYLYFAILSPQVWDKIVETQKAVLADNKNLSSDQLDNAIEITRKWGPLFGAIGILFVTPIVGAIIALVGAAIFKKEPTILDIEQSSDANTDPAV